MHDDEFVFTTCNATDCARAMMKGRCVQKERPASPGVIG